MTEEIRFEGKVAIVTGAGGGLGRTHALLLAARGAKVVVNDLGGATDGSGSGTSMADQVVEEIRAAGGEAIANYDSVATPEGGAAIVASALETYGRVDILINNAGILRDRSFLKQSTDDLEAVIDVHLKGAFFVTKPAFAQMKQQGHGRIIFTSSSAGTFGNFGQSNYGSAKMGLVGLTKVLSIEGARYDIHANAIAPVARTRMTEQVLGPLAESFPPEQVSGLVAWLCSPECEVSGECFSVGGGRIARIFVGLTRGWFAGKGEVPTPEQVRSQWGAINDPADHLVPQSVTDGLQIFTRLLS